MRRARALALALCTLASSACHAPPVPTLAPPAAPLGARPWLFVSDVHFDPFADPAIVDRLAATPPARWDAVFARTERQPSPGVGHDTNAALLRSSLAAMRSVDPDPPVVVIAGDFLAHRFDRLYAATRTGRGGDARRARAAYEAFMDATIAYLAKVFDRAFPRARFLIAIGNNDGYCGDYGSTPHSPFLLHMARAWQPLVDRDRDVPDFVRSFSASGAYAVRLPLEGDVRALVTNSVIWSTDYGNACARNDDGPRREQQAFVRRSARAGGPATRWWLVTHIPPGIDVFASLERGRPVPMYRPRPARDLLALRLSGGRTFELIVCGHTHGSAFRSIGGAGGSGTAPIALVPSITPVNGNDPAFAVAEVAPDGSLADEIVYAARQPVLGGMPVWHESYAFDAAFGASAFDAASIARARAALQDDVATRGRFYLQQFASGGIAGAIEFAMWRREWCAIDVDAAGDYERCLARGRG